MYDCDCDCVFVVRVILIMILIMFVSMLVVVIMIMGVIMIVIMIHAFMQGNETRPEWICYYCVWLAFWVWLWWHIGSVSCIWHNWCFQFKFNIISKGIEIYIERYIDILRQRYWDMREGEREIYIDRVRLIERDWYIEEENERCRDMERDITNILHLLQCSCNSVNNVF